jgi:hypothetical protein
VTGAGDRFRPCRFDGCTRQASLTTGYCRSHYLTIRSRLRDHGTIDATREFNSTRKPDEVRAEVRRRIRNFEKPDVVARDLGISLRTLHKIMSEKAAS